MLGDQARWGIVEQLLAAAVDTLTLANWQRGGNKKAKRPKPIPRPGIVDQDDNIKTFRAKRSYSIAEMRDILDNWGG